MPFIDTKVNISLTEEEKELMKKKFGEAIELIPGKTENWLMVGFDDQYTMFFKGKSMERLAFVEVKIFGKANKQSYSQLTERICNIFEEVLKIPQEQVYITYQEIEHWGWNGNNF